MNELNICGLNVILLCTDYLPKGTLHLSRGGCFRGVVSPIVWFDWRDFGLTFYHNGSKCLPYLSKSLKVALGLTVAHFRQRFPRYLSTMIYPVDKECSRSRWMWVLRTDWQRLTIALHPRAESLGQIFGPLAPEHPILLELPDRKGSAEANSK